MIEIRWHGRGGQGAKTASHLLAVAAMDAGRWVQSFPEYGAERSGAAVRAFDRLDDRPVRRRSPVTHPDVVVVLDETLLEEVDVTEGLGSTGVLIVNSAADPEALGCRSRFRGRVLAVPCADIAARTGAGRGNVVILGALAGVLGEPPVSAVRAAIDGALGRKLDPAALEGAAAAMEAGYRVALAADVRLHAGPSRLELHHGERRAKDADSGAELEPYQALEAAAVVVPGTHPRPNTGAWREGSRPRLDAHRCVDCLLCWVYCPDMAVLVQDGHLTGFDYALCKGCELCAEVCPVDAIAMVPEPDAMPLRLLGGVA